MNVKIYITLSIIFALTSCGEKVDEAWVSVNLPGPPVDQVEENDEVSLDIFVFAKHYTYLGEKMDLVKLEEKLKSIDNKTTVNIKVGKDAKHKRLVSLLDVMNKHGFTTFNLHTLKDPLKSEK